MDVFRHVYSHLVSSHLHLYPLGECSPGGGPLVPEAGRPSLVEHPELTSQRHHTCNRGNDSIRTQSFLHCLSAKPLLSAPTSLDPAGLPWPCPATWRAPPSPSQPSHEAARRQYTGPSATRRVVGTEDSGVFLWTPPHPTHGSPEAHPAGSAGWLGWALLFLSHTFQCSLASCTSQHVDAPSHAVWLLLYGTDVSSLVPKELCENVGISTRDVRPGGGGGQTSMGLQ